VPITTLQPRGAGLRRRDRGRRQRLAVLADSGDLDGVRCTAGRSSWRAISSGRSASVNGPNVRVPSRTCRSAACGDSGTGWREAGTEAIDVLLGSQDALRQPRSLAGCRCPAPSPSWPGARRLQRASRARTWRRWRATRCSRTRSPRRAPAGCSRTVLVCRPTAREIAAIAAPLRRRGSRACGPAAISGPHVAGHRVGATRARRGRDEELFSILRARPARSAPQRRSGAPGTRFTLSRMPIRCARSGRVKEQPRGRCGRIEGDSMGPAVAADGGRGVPTHSRQFADLPRVYVQDSSLGDRLDADSWPAARSPALAWCRSSPRGWKACRSTTRRICSRPKKHSAQLPAIEG